MNGCAVADRCKVCGQDILVGETYFDFDGETVHKECLTEYLEGKENG